MNRVMKKIASLGILGIFIMSMLPVALAASSEAKEESDEEMWLEAYNEKEQDAASEKQPALRPADSDISEVFTGAKRIQPYEYMAIEAHAKKIAEIRQKHDIKEYVEVLESDEENSNYGMPVTEYVRRIITRLYFILSIMEKRMSNDAEFLREHPEALQVLKEIKGELQKHDVKLAEVMKDGEVTREEWAFTVKPAIKEVRKIVTRLKAHRRLFDDWKHRRVKLTAGKVVMDLAEKQEKIKARFAAQGMTKAEIDERMKIIAEQQAILSAEAESGQDGVRTRLAMEKIKNALASHASLKGKIAYKASAQKIDARMDAEAQADAY